MIEEVVRQIDTHTEWNISIHEKNILPFVSLDKILPSEISQTEINTTWYHLYFEAKEIFLRSQTHRNTEQENVCQDLGGGEIGKGKGEMKRKKTYRKT